MPIGLQQIVGGNFDGWFDIYFAEAYFATRLNASPWTGAESDTKVAALATAQADIEFHPDFTFTDEDKATPATAMKNAVCEQALFRLADPDMDLRQSMRAQGVTAAWMVQEQYRQGKTAGAVIAPKARDLLAAYAAQRTKARSHALIRAEAPAEDE